MKIQCSLNDIKTNYIAIIIIYLTVINNIAIIQSI